MDWCVGASPSHLAASSGCVGGKGNYGEGCVASPCTQTD